MKYPRLYVTTLICLAFTIMQAQEFSYFIEANGSISNGNYTPFWHVSNRQGLGSVDTNSGYMRVGLLGRNKFSDNRWDITYGIDIVAANDHTSTLFIQQAYADINYKILRLSVGQKERWGNLKNHRLSSGSLTESGNARPIPQIRIEVPEYWNIPGTGKWISLRGHIAYGWFSDGSWQKDFVTEGKSHTAGVRYHSKAGFIKIGNRDKFPITFEAGLEMVAQFGGSVYNMLNIEGKNLHNPTGFKDYFKVFIPSSGDDEYDIMDQANIAGNHLGSWHAAVTWHGKKHNLCAYYEHTFEDHSQMFMEYGLWTEQLVGIELQLKEFKWIKNIAIEYFNLKNHSGPIYHDSTDKIPDQISCRDNNYNHRWYNGWFNYGMVIGTPLVISPIYNADGTLTTYNNRLEAYHLGIEGEPTKSIKYRLLLTHSNNWGTYDVPFTDILKNMSGMAEVTLSPEKIKGWSITTSLAFDNGELLGDNFGGMLSISKTGIFKFKKGNK